MIHQANGGSWTRYYRCAADSNRLLTTSLPGDDPNGPYTGEYKYNLHGSMTFMPHLPADGLGLRGAHASVIDASVKRRHG